MGKLSTIYKINNHWSFLEKFYSKKDCLYFHHCCFLLILFAKSIYAITFHSLHKTVLYLEAVSSNVINTRSFLRHVYYTISFSQFYNLFYFIFFLIKLWMICLCVAKDNHCTLASLPQYRELSLILHDMRNGFIYGYDYKSFLLNTISHLITFYLKYGWRIWNIRMNLQLWVIKQKSKSSS